MAALDLVAEYVPFLRQLKDSGVKRVEFSGAGATLTEIAAAGASGTRIIITGGRMSANGADVVDIVSGASTVKDTLYFAGADTVSLPAGLEMTLDEAMSFDKTGAVVVIRGWVDYVTITDGQPLGIIGLAGRM